MVLSIEPETYCQAQKKIKYDEINFMTQMEKSLLKATQINFSKNLIIMAITRGWIKE